MNLPFKMIIETEMEKYRAESFWDKEPETIEWIKSFKPEEVFYDIGANVGVYSLYAASLYPDSEIYAFEPVPDNYYRLIQNIGLNGFTNIRAFNMAFGKNTELTKLFLTNTEIGASGAQIIEPVDEDNHRFVPHGTFTIQCFTVEDFIRTFRLQNPNHIKIDVDGHELDILLGASWTLYQPEVKSVLVECNREKIEIYRLKNSMAIRNFLVDSSLNNHPNHSRIRRGGNPENIIFTKGGN